MTDTEYLMFSLMLIALVIFIPVIITIELKKPNSTYSYKRGIKIIKQGRHIQREIKRTCKDCGCEVEFDIYATTLYTDHAKVTHRRIWCPNCGECMELEVTEEEQTSGFRY